MRGAGLQQAVREAAGRRADVQAAPSGDVEPELRQRVGELDPATRDEARRLVDRDLDVRIDELARLLRALAALPTRTSPAITDAAARVRDSNRPRSAKRVSRRTRATAANGT